MDNQEDVAFLESAEGSQAIVDLHVEGIRYYLSLQLPNRTKSPGHSIADGRGILFVKFEFSVYSMSRVKLPIKSIIEARLNLFVFIEMERFRIWSYVIKLH